MARILVIAALAAAASSVDAFHVGTALPALRAQRHVSLGAPVPRFARRSLMRMAEGEEPPAVPPVVEEEEIVEAAAAPKSNQFKVKIDKSGAGFNQFDPVRALAPPLQSSNHTKHLFTLECGIDRVTAALQVLPCLGAQVRSSRSHALRLTASLFEPYTLSSNPHRALLHKPFKVSPLVTCPRAPGPLDHVVHLAPLRPRRRPRRRRPPCSHRGLPLPHLTDFSQIHNLINGGVRYNSINFGVQTRPVSPDWRDQL